MYVDGSFVKEINYSLYGREKTLQGGWQALKVRHTELFPGERLTTIMAAYGWPRQAVGICTLCSGNFPGNKRAFDVVFFPFFC